jgi:hypothetical protein
MGGFLLKARHGDNELSFPINAKQLLYLVGKGHLDLPSLDKADIEDKSKADKLSRFVDHDGIQFCFGLLTIGGRTITAAQALWFLVNSIARLAQGMAITTLELTTLSFVVVMFATSISWLHKPSDVARPTILLCKSTIEQIHLKVNMMRSTELFPIKY